MTDPKPTFTELDVALFWECATGFMWTEWMAFTPEERGIVISAHRKLSASPDDYGDPRAEDEAEAPPAPQGELEKIPGINV